MIELPRFRVAYTVQLSRYCDKSRNQMWQQLYCHIHGFEGGVVCEAYKNFPITENRLLGKNKGT